MRSGEVKDVMALPDDVDSLSFGPPIDRGGGIGEPGRVREVAIGVAALVIRFLLGIGSAMLRRRKPVSDTRR